MYFPSHVSADVTLRKNHNYTAHMFKTIEQSNQLPVLYQPFTNPALAAPEPPHTPKEAVGGGMASRLLTYLAEKVQPVPRGPLPR